MKTKAKKKMSYLFPKEDIRITQLSDRIFFYRQSSCVGVASMVSGEVKEYCIQGFYIPTAPCGDTEQIRMDTFRLGTFLFDPKQYVPAGFELRDENSIRFTMAAIVLGERSANYHLNGGSLKINSRRKSDVLKAQEVLRRWEHEWSEQPFRDHCKKTLPLHEAAESIKMTPDSLKKQLQALRLPL